MIRPTFLQLAFYLLLPSLLIGSLWGTLHYRQCVIDLQQKLANAENRIEPAADFAPILMPDPVPLVGKSTEQQPIVALEEELAQLRQKVTTQDNLIASLQQQAQTALQVQINKPVELEEADSQLDAESELVDLKTSDPQRYAEMVALREQAREKVNDVLSMKQDFLFRGDPSDLPPEEQEAYGYMLNLLNDTWLLADQVNAEDVAWEERRSARKQLQRNLRELGPMLKTERNIELIELGLSLGYDDTGAREFSRYIESIVKATSMSDVWQAMGRSWRREQQAARRAANDSEPTPR